MKSQKISRIPVCRMGFITSSSTRSIGGTVILNLEIQHFRNFRYFDVNHTHILNMRFKENWSSLLISHFPNFK